MSATKGLSLPIGTKVRRKSDGGKCIRVRGYGDNELQVRFILEKGNYEWWMEDDEWELIEEDPKQGDIIEVRSLGGPWSLEPYVCTYLGKVYTEGMDGIMPCDEWRFPPKKLNITLQEIADWKGVEKELINIINE